MKWSTILTTLLVSALVFGQKKAQTFEVSDLSASDSPISFTGATKVLKTGTACVVTAHNNSSKSLLAMVATADVTTRYERDQPVTFQYDGFFKETLIGPGLDFDVVDEGMYSAVEVRYVNGVPVEPPPPNFLCHANAKVLFIQFEDGSTWGDYQTGKDVMARRTTTIAWLGHLVDAYDSGGEAAFAAALDEPESKRHQLKFEADYFKITVIDLVRKRLAAAQKRQASGIF